MGLLKKAMEYREYVSNKEMEKLADWYARGPPSLSEPITEEEVDKRVQEDINDMKYDFPDFIEKTFPLD